MYTTLKTEKKNRRTPHLYTKEVNNDHIYNRLPYGLFLLPRSNKGNINSMLSLCAE
jgi:hypothetical protein